MELSIAQGAGGSRWFCWHNATDADARLPEGWADAFGGERLPNWMEALNRR